jgi:hypothetical protein
LAPCSYARCDECYRSKRLWIKDIAIALTGKANYDREFGPEYFEKFLRPSLVFYGMTEEEMLAEGERLLLELDSDKNMPA